MNIWGTDRVVSIASELEAELAAQSPQHGGIMVAQVATLAGVVYRMADGYSLELCEDCVRVHRVGMGSKYATIALSALTYAGDHIATAEELEQAALEDDITESFRRISSGVRVVASRTPRSAAYSWQKLDTSALAGTSSK